MSSLPAEQLPHCLKPNNGVLLVCKVESTLSRHDLRRKNYKWYNLKQEHHLAEFEVKMLISTGLRFEIWGQGEHGQKAVRSKAHDEILVAWEAPDDPSAAEEPRQHLGEIFPAF